MSENTAEEKLRRDIEGDIFSVNTKAKKIKRRPIGKSKKPDEIGQAIVDSLMGDLEKRIEQSLNSDNVFKAPEVKKEKHEAVKNTTAKHYVSPKTSHKELKPHIVKKILRTETKSEPELNVKVKKTEEAKIIPEPVEPPEVKQPVEVLQPEEIQEPVNELYTVEEVVNEVNEPENIEPVEKVREPEIETPEIISESVESVEPPEAEQPEEEQQSEEIQEPLPVLIEDDDDNNEEEIENFEEIEETVENLEEVDELPDIPLISEEGSEQEEEEFLPDVPVINAEEDSGEDELPIINAEIENEDDNNNEIENDSIPAQDENEIVLNVNYDFPTTEQKPEEPDPESEIAPVSVTMPESTKTAEDKLMADIAEAMTGNPLTLENREAPELYKLPDDFLTGNDVNSQPSQQSAEDKLRANIAQAMSESPLDAAQENAVQDFENDLISLDLSEYEGEVSEPEPFIETLDLMPNSDYEPEAEEPEQEETESPEPQIELEIEEKTEDEIEPEADNFEDLLAVKEENINETSEPVIEENIIEEEEVPLPDPEPEPEAPEISEPLEAFVNENENTEITEENIEPEIKIENENNDIQIEEATNQNNMAETSLLDDDININDNENINDDDWDISSLGDLGAVASMPEYEPEPEIEIGETQNTPPVKNENENLNNGGEEKNEEKIMGIREKLAARKGGAKTSSGNENSSGKSSWLVPLLMIALTVVGGMILWELKQLNDKMTLTMMNMGSGNFESIPGIEAAPSYDYSVDFIFDTNLTERMAQRGHDGWQVVGSRRTQDSITGQLGYEFIFMRKTPGR